MSVKGFSFGLIALIILVACQASHKPHINDSTQEFSKSVRFLDPTLVDNQLSGVSTYDGQLILTVENDSVIKEISAIKEIHDAVEEIYFIKSNNSFESVVYAMKLKKSINPIPYYNFLNEYEGVLGVEFDGIVGVAGSN